MDTIPIKNMEDAVKNDCTQSDLILNLSKRAPRFKAGAELSKSVNLMDAEWNEELTDTHQVLEVKLHLRSEGCIAKACDCEEE